MLTHFRIAVALIFGATLIMAPPLAPPAQAQSEDACKIDAQSVGDDFVALLKAPGDWGTSEWVAFGAVGALTTGLIVKWDEDILRVSQENPESFPYAVIHKLAWLGKWYGKNDINPIITFAGVTGGLFLIGKARDDDYLVRTTGIMTESYLFTAGFTIAIKLLTGRSRPSTGEGAKKWRFIGLHKRQTRSFPSGHAASAFSMVGALTSRHSEWWVQVPAWTLGTGFAAQRIDSGAHWTSDVLVGAVMGYAISSFLADRHTCPAPASGAAPATSYITFGFDF